MSGKLKYLTSISKGRQLELLEKHKAFWKRTPGSEALIGFAPASHLFPLQNLGIAHEGLFGPENVSEDLMKNDAAYKPQFDPDDDLFPARIPMEWMEWSQAYCGAEVHLSTRAGTVWVKPADNIPRNVSELKEHLRPVWLEKLLQATGINLDAAGDELLISESLLRGPADCLEAVIGAQELCMRLLDAPELLGAMTNWLSDRVIELTKAQLKHVSHYHGGTINRYRLWGPGNNIVTQADISALMSPEHFEEVFIPAYRKLAREFDTVTMHFHSCAHRHTEALLKIDELSAIEWGMDPTGPTLEDMIPVFARILESKSLILMNIKSDAEVKMLLNKLPSEGLCIIQRK